MVLNEDAYVLDVLFFEFSVAKGAVSGFYDWAGRIDEFGSVHNHWEKFFQLFNQ